MKSLDKAYNICNNNWSEVGRYINCSLIRIIQANKKQVALPEESVYLLANFINEDFKKVWAENNLLKPKNRNSLYYSNFYNKIINACMIFVPLNVIPVNNFLTSTTLQHASNLTSLFNAISIMLSSIKSSINIICQNIRYYILPKYTPASPIFDYK